jgi:16S rRNA (cytosine967-C5)-methyltransferase
MTPAARLQAAIEILDQVLDGMAAEQALTGWARRSRFAGSKDRAAVRDHVFDALRNRNSFADLGGSLTGRGLMLGALRSTGTDPDSLFTGEGYAPSELTAAERGPFSGNPDVVNLPDWLWSVIQSDLGDQAAEVENRLRKRAPVFLRVNLKKTTRDKAIGLLAREGIEVTPHSSAETALIVDKGDRRIRTSAAFRDGLVELQDGASQAVAACLPLKDGQKVLDYCAGGGGKALAIAARADLKVTAHDISAARMRDIPERSRRAGVSIQTATSENLTQSAPFDLVLCDAPCSGSGSWRRAPEAKWDLTPARLEELTRIQSDILSQVKGLIRPGGILAYATCSVLTAENSAQVDGFLQSNPEWTLLKQQQWLLQDETDGFFLALFRAP